jgi:hypothetical protein
MVIQKRNNGWITTEIIVSLAILSVLFFGLIKTMKATGRLNKLHLARQRCLAAAQAQLDCIEATDRQLSEEDFERLWPTLEVTIEESAGQDEWNQLKLVKVTVTDKSLHREVKVQLCRYIGTGKRQQ